MLKKLILIILKMCSILAICEKGCLKCDKENNCLFCDFSKMYRLSPENKSCVIEEKQQNCLYMDTFGKCKICDKDYYLESNSAKCVEVERGALINNCIFYTNTGACQTCRRNFYLQGNTCQEVETSIDNCEFYLTQNICLDCETNYILSNDGKTCTQSPEESNCSLYSKFNCSECIGGFYLNKNLFDQNLFKFNSDENKKSIGDHINELNVGKPMIKNVLVCQNLSTLNCEKPLSPTECQKCAKGYVVDKSKKCKQIPNEPIPFCKKYLAIDQCMECSGGYWLKSSTICEPVQSIENCQTYDGTARTSSCLQCDQAYFSQGSTCSQRKSSNIENCEKYDPKADKCSACNQENVISTDGLKCFKKILNCSVFQDSNTEATCKICNSGFYLKDAKNCLEGKVPNCDKYKNREDDCQECINGYYLKDKKCINHDNIPYCDKYSPSDANYCIKCLNEYHNFKVTKTCKYFSPINNCLEYESSLPLTCKKCELNYELKNGSSCQLIDLPNCVKFEGSVCNACTQNYALDDSESSGYPKCSAIYSYTSTNCNKSSASEPSNSYKLDQVYCKQCESFHYPINHKLHYVCVANDQLPSLSIKGNKLIQYCIKYDDARNCVQCESDKFLAKDGTCTLSCSTGVYRVLKHSKTGTVATSNLKILFEGYKQCRDANTENKQVFAFDLAMENENELDIAIKCKDGTIPLVYLTNKSYSNVNISGTAKEFMNNYMRKVPAIVTCASPTTNSPLISNCDYYGYVRIKGVNEMRCLKCQQGYNSIISSENQNTSGSTKSYFINQCKRDTNCKTTEKQGLDLVWTKLFSCHECLSSNYIPFLSFKHTSTTNPEPVDFMQYSLDSVDHSQSPDLNRKNIECFEDSANTFGYNPTNTTQLANYQKLPDNCALGVLNLSITDGNAKNNQVEVTGTSIPNIAQYCAACKAGYRATPININYQHVKVRCERIENCSGSDWFNYCSQCNLNFSYSWKDNKVNFEECISHPDNNCFASSNGICMACKSGFNLNSDSFCESFNPPQCKSSEYFNLRKEHDSKNILFGSYHDYLGVGCNECIGGYTAVQLTNSSSAPFVCVNSTYLQQQELNLKPNTIFIKYCENYGVEQDNILCKKCLDTFVLSEDKLKCFDGPFDCEVGETNTRCKRCKEGKVLVNSECKTGDIPFCKLHNREINTADKRCAICEPEYYLTKEFVCQKGIVINCEIYVDQQKNKCTKCRDGYAKFSNNNSDYCFKIDPSLNCINANLITNTIYGAEIECTKCNNPNELLTAVIGDIKDKTLCMPFNTISFCKEYGIGESLASSTFLCVNCMDGYYLTDPTTCSNRLYNSQSCNIYMKDKDRCEECNEEYFLDNLGNCIPKPTGIPNCINYSDTDTCSECKQNFYLENGQCIKVQVLIEGCESYSNSSTCSKCKQLFYLDGNQCVVAKATNCLTYLSASACNTCPKGYGKKEANTLTNCVIINKPNCLEFEQDGPYLCLQCREGYYVDASGACTLANPVILGCEFYNNNEECSSCKKGYALSQDKKSCLNLLPYLSKNAADSNCLRYEEKTKCSICRQGTVFDENNVCIECVNSEKCLKCNPFNKDECLICQTNYYMDNNQKCIAVVAPPVPPKPDNNFSAIIYSLLFTFVLFS